MQWLTRVRWGLADPLTYCNMHIHCRSGRRSAKSFQLCFQFVWLHKLWNACFNSHHARRSGSLQGAAWPPVQCDAVHVENASNNLAYLLRVGAAFSIASAPAHITV